MLNNDILVILVVIVPNSNQLYVVAGLLVSITNSDGDLAGDQVCNYLCRCV